MQARYRLSPRGFLMSARATPLPAKYAAWESLAARLSELNRTASLRTEVDNLPIIGVDAGELDDAALRRARVILTCLVHSFVFGHLVPWRHLQQQCPGGGQQYVPPSAGDNDGTNRAKTSPPLPEQLATPWRLVSSYLGMPLVLTATDVDLWNAAPYASGADPPSTEWVPRFQQIFRMTATRSEHGFHAVPHAVNRALAPVVPALLLAPSYVRERRVRQLTRVCTELAAALAAAKSQLERIHAEVDVAEFYDFYRFLLGGWPNGGLALPASAAYGLDAATADHVGPSAGQTAAIILIDIILGIEHADGLRAFQKSMRTYMPQGHTRLLVDLETELATHGTLRGMATAPDAPRHLRSAYDGACSALAALRTFHLGVATHYLRKALKGTGGSDFRSLLNEGVASTRNAVGCARGLS